MLRAKRCGWMLGLVLLVLTAVGGNAAPLHPEPPGPTTPLFECTGNGEIGPIEKPVDGPLAWIVGDFIWDDLNRNGIQDPAEPGLAGVECLLCIASRTQPLQRRTTSSQGYYAFTGVPAGNFFIAVRRLPGYVFSPKDQGNDDTRDSDVNAQGVSELFPLGTGGGTTLKWDAGQYRVTYSRIHLPLILKK